MNKKPGLSRNTLKTAKRLLGYVTNTYKVQFIIVCICILVSSVATISVSFSLKFLLDDFIMPLIGQTDPNFKETVSGADGSGRNLCLWCNCILCLYQADGCYRAGSSEKSQRRNV